MLTLLTILTWFASGITANEIYRDYHHAAQRRRRYRRRLALARVRCINNINVSYA